MATTPARPPVDHERIRRAVREILAAVGEDPDREGLLETPDRVARMYAEIFSGLHTDPAVHLQKTFTQKHDEMVLVKDIEFASCCEHHLLPFTGKAHIAYLPDGQVVGLSKLARVVEAVARRPQVQERMTEEIADLIMTRAEAPRRRRDRRGEPHLHDDPRRAQARGDDDHQFDARRFPRPPADAGGADGAGVWGEVVVRLAERFALCCAILISSSARQMTSLPETGRRKHSRHRYRGMSQLDDLFHEIRPCLPQLLQPETGFEPYFDGLDDHVGDWIVSENIHDPHQHFNL